MPQFALSLCVLVQVLTAPEVQSVWLAGHVVVHAPVTHAWPAGQRVPHVPQFALSLCVFAQYAVAPEPQSARPPPQVVPHAPFEHT